MNPSGADTVYWVGADGNVYHRVGDTVYNRGKLIQDYGNGFDAANFSAQSTQIADPNPPAATGGGGGTADPDAASRNALLGEITGLGGDVDSIYGALFADLEKLIRSRDAELETQYGEQLKKAGDQFAAAIPEIEGSYAAIGAADSTDNWRAKNDAKEGFEETTKTIGKNKEADKAKLGQYKENQRVKFTEDQNSAKREIGRAGETTDVDALRSLRNNVQDNISAARVSQSNLMTDEGGRGAVRNLTQDAGRFEAATNALDSIIKSSMSGAVKEAAVKAVTDSAGLSDDEKKKVDQMYGNVYAEQQAI